MGTPEEYVPFFRARAVNATVVQRLHAAFTYRRFEAHLKPAFDSSGIDPRNVLFGVTCDGPVYADNFTFKVSAPTGGGPVIFELQDKGHTHRFKGELVSNDPNLSKDLLYTLVKGFEREPEEIKKEALQDEPAEAGTEPATEIEDPGSEEDPGSKLEAPSTDAASAFAPASEEFPPDHSKVSLDTIAKEARRTRREWGVNQSAEEFKRSKLYQTAMVRVQAHIGASTRIADIDLELRALNGKKETLERERRKLEPKLMNPEEEEAFHAFAQYFKTPRSQ